jgi:hypothetical protein
MRDEYSLDLDDPSYRKGCLHGAMYGFAVSTLGLVWSALLYWYA